MSEDLFDCDMCGACCRNLIIEIDELDLVREAKLIPVSQPFKIPPGQILVDDDGEPTTELIPGYGAGAMLACGSAKPCPMLGEDNRCSIYPTRPNVCVAMRAGSDQCQDARRMSGLEPLMSVRELVGARM